jgi:hypothetical protein
MPTTTKLVSDNRLQRSSRCGSQSRDTDRMELLCNWRPTQPGAVDRPQPLFRLFRLADQFVDRTALYRVAFVDRCCHRDRALQRSANCGCSPAWQRQS